MNTDNVLEFLKENYSIDFTQDDLERIGAIQQSSDNALLFKKTLYGLSSEDIKSYFIFFLENECKDEANIKALKVLEHSKKQRNNYEEIRKTLASYYDERVEELRKWKNMKRFAKFRLAELLPEILPELIESGDLKLSELINLEKERLKKEKEDEYYEE